MYIFLLKFKKSDGCEKNMKREREREEKKKLK